jgi:hypothetical protein
MSTFLTNCVNIEASAGFFKSYIALKWDEISKTEQ